MKSEADYQIIEKLYESPNSLVYRALLAESEQTVILKILKQDYPNPSELTKYKQEYEITCRLASVEGVIQAYSLNNYKNTLAILLEDFGARSLKLILKDSEFSVLEFLEIAIQVSESLEEIHAGDVIHKDINSSNIVFNPETHQVKIIDFGISTSFSRESPTLKNPDILEGTLAYISPEQTGRMNRFLDYRTDFYSLGVTFYELLTWQLPFDVSDPLDLVHCHIAKFPTPPHQLKPEIPVALSSIVMKLLSKTAEERYQSARGIKADLETCLKHLQTQNSIPEFPLGSCDRSDRFQIPQKLYGREHEIEVLLAAFERVALGQKLEFLLVAGYSGIGKSSLVQELYKPITEKKGYFITGKFDQFQRNIPYSAVVNAFRFLGKQILTESRDRLLEWRKKLLKVLGVNGQIIIDVIPEIEQIIGPQPPLPSLEPVEAQNIFKAVFQSFIGVFCQQEHPLVVFLDDLQWADSASLKFIELMMSNSALQYLLIIGAYRDNEVDPDHPLMNLLSRLQERKLQINTTSLQPLKDEHLCQLIADTLHQEKDEVQSLTRLVADKTSGNPFFVNELLKTIHRERLLQFDRNRGVWQWDIDQIGTLEITENVVDLMVAKMKALPESAQQLLSLSACIGNNFDLNTLAVINEKTPPETFKILLPAISSGLIQPISALEVSSEQLIESSLVIREYKFLHDRIQQAAYTLIEDDQKQVIHLKIGKLLYENTSPDELEDKIFDLVNHFNQAKELLAEIPEKIELARLNLIAGKRAKKSIAFGPAKEYLQTALNELPANMWEDYYEISLEIHQELADTEYLNGNFEQSQSLIYRSIEKTRSALDSNKFYVLLVIQYTLLAKYPEAIGAGTDALRALGVDVPEDNFESALEVERQIVMKGLGDRTIDSLYDLPEMEDLEKKAALIVLERLFSAAWAGKPELLAVLIVKHVNISIKYGNDRGSGFGYSNFAVVHSHIFHEYQRGYEFAILALRLSEKYNDLSYKCCALNFIANFAAPWVKHFKYSENLYLEGVDAGIQSGNLQFAGYTMGYGLTNQFFQGKNLDLLFQKSQRHQEYFIETKNQFIQDTTIGLISVLSNLLELTREKFKIGSEVVDEEKYLETCRAIKSWGPIGFYYIFKAQASYIHGEPVNLKYLRDAEEFSEFFPGNVTIVTKNLYYSLTLTRLYPEASQDEQELSWQTLQENQKWMKLWSDNCPDNFLHQYLLVEAEIARISGKLQEAMALYDRAIASAREQEFIQNEAIANELAANFWQKQNKVDFAELYMRRAYQGYEIWGAKRKVELLKREYPQWFVSQPSHSQSTVDTTTGRATETLDIATVIKASQTLSGEIVLKNLLGKLMEIAIANAGAEKGFLLLKKEDNWFIEAEGSIGNLDVKALQSIPIESKDGEENPLLPLAIVNFVTRAKESVILNDAVQEGEYNRDPYIIANQTKSILCTPLIEQSQLSGVLYLENNLTTNAFTSDRVALLRIISSQAAISIENARLYDTLERRVEERTAELSQTVEVLEKTQAELKLENALLKSDEQTDSFDYQIGGSLNVNAPTYVVRSADRHLYQAMRQGQFCYTFNARQMGKSSLMVRIMNGLRKEGYRCISIDLTGVGGENTTPDQWYKGIAVEMWRKFKLLRKFKLKPWWSELTDIPAPQRLKQFIEEVVLTEVKKEDRDEPANIVIFLDEIDCILSLPFPVNDFFALIRACYNQRALDPIYDRLTFALFGSATPSTLIADPQKTPFNIGRPIHLEGFKVNEAQPLLYGLTVNNPQTVLKAIIDWTGGQPFLTQKVCALIRNAKTEIPPNGEEKWIADLVDENILKNWEAKDDPEHLKTVRDRILKSDRRQELLSIYQQIVLEGEAPATYSETEKELLLSGLAIAREGILKVNNRIYQSIFDRQWLEGHFSGQ